MKTSDLTKSALGAVLLALSAFLTVPMAVPFTLQIFAVVCLCLVIGAERSAFSLLLYVVLGALGLPIFSGFSGGVGHLFGPSGGYIVGFFFFPLVCRCFAVTRTSASRKILFVMLLGLFACYAVGSVWFCLYYRFSGVEKAFLSTLAVTVLPYVIPDVLKITLAVAVAKRLKI